MRIPPQIENFREQHSDRLIKGIVKAVSTTPEDFIKSFRLKANTKAPTNYHGQFGESLLIELQEHLFIPSIGLTINDNVEVCIRCEVENAQKGYDCYLEEIANLTTGRIYKTLESKSSKK